MKRDNLNTTSEFILFGYRKKGSDPINGLNYTRSFSLKATSPTTAILVSYTHLEAALR